MTPSALIVWAIGLGVAFAVGWAHGRTSRPDTPRPAESGEWRQGYLAGYEGARDEALRLAKAHDFAAIERQVGRMGPQQ